MAFIDPDKIPLLPNVALTLALAVVGSSTSPLLLLDEEGVIVGVSDSFISGFDLEPGDIVGRSVYEIGDGEWNVARLKALLVATASGTARLPSYEIDLVLPRHGRRRLVLNARLLDYDVASIARILLAVADVTDARAAEKIKDDLLHEKARLMQEVHHRVANSLQIIASVLMNSARALSNEEARFHLKNAHGRVMAFSDLERQLAQSEAADVDLDAYLRQLRLSLGASMIDDPERITINVSAKGPRVLANVSVSLGLLVTELVINALKHGFPDGRAGTITVNYTGDDAGWTLAIADDGVGMGAANDAVAGLGTSIVTALARHLGGTVETTDGNPGTIVSITGTNGVIGSPVVPPDIPV
jgi:two-component sensor histidine kinase